MKEARRDGLGCAGESQRVGYVPRFVRLVTVAEVRLCTVNLEKMLVSK